MKSSTTGSPARDAVVDRLQELGAVAVIRLTDSQKLMKVAAAIAEGGVPAIEVTMTVPNALQMIEEIAHEMGQDVVIGVGSVLNAQTATDAISAGVRYVVSPVFKTEVIDAAHRLDVPAMPGCFTPTEILTAQEYGADIVKVFPADVLGMAFFSGIKAPMPHLRLMPTGGVTLTNAGDWIRAGACAVGVGGALLDKKAITDGRYDVLTANARILTESIRNAR